MSDLQQLSRILYRHDWADVEDWADGVARLADLSDEEIAALATSDDDGLAPGTAPGHAGNGRGEPLSRARAAPARVRAGGLRSWWDQMCAVLALAPGSKYRRA